MEAFEKSCYAKRPMGFISNNFIGIYFLSSAHI
jgi:hypothetical protein